MKKLILFGLVFILLITSVSALNQSNVAFWLDIQEGAGITLDNANNNSGLDGTLTGAASWITSCPTNISKGLDLDGATNYITLNDDAALDTGNNFSVAIWVNMDVLAETYFMNRFTGGQTFYWSAFRDGGAVDKTGDGLLIGDGGSNDFFASSAGTISASSNMFLVMTYEEGQVTSYHNSVLDRTELLTETIINNNANYLRIGSAYGGATKLNGKVCQALQFNQVLNQTEITKLYAGGDGCDWDCFFNTATESNFTINAKDFYNSTVISNFSVEIDNHANYSTTTGVITTNITQNATSPTYNITIWNITNYFNETFINYNSNVSLVANITPYTLIRANSFVTGSSISNFNVTYNSILYPSSNNIVYIPLYNETSEVNCNANLHASVTTNLTGSPYLETYNFTLYGLNSIYFNFYDASSGLLMDYINVTLEITSDNSFQKNTTDNGTFYVDLLSPEDYIIKYYADSYDNKFYYLDVVDDSTTILNLYLTNQSTSDVTFTIFDQLGNYLENATVKSLSHINGTSTYVVTSMGKTNPNGQLVLPLILNTELYKFNIEYEGILRKSTSAAPLTTTTQEIIIDLGVDYITDLSTVFGISSSLFDDWDNGTNFNVTYIFDDSRNSISQGCVYIYENVASGFSLINSSCGLGASGSITLNAAENEGVFTILGSIVYDGVEYKVEQYILTLVSDTSISNDETIFLSMFLILAVGLGGFLVAPFIGFLGMGLATIGVTLIGIFTMNIGMPIATVFIILGVVVGILSGRQK